MDPIPTDIYVGAMNITDYADSRLAGAYIEVTGPKGKVNLLITDLLPEGKKGDVDLNEKAFPLITDKAAGRVKISWKIIPRPGVSTLSFKFNEIPKVGWAFMLEMPNIQLKSSKS